ncbi:antibiotic biosynthesis monooxygenase [Leptospira wolffii]|uniref:Antibiotic biosynthesis monooxygenase n=1 Tax=Leptospira wolffii TaxID=409998 RepID=A0A2M9ZCQ1_9LEPT|nr:putative quinol monooxygenase [Leptospira wolffii]PJZ66132.1 antibiotic biosynthesis monooxygenase [Leptospira wolffii]TGK58777.1 antibiotic biosynthesis monooxygenase [Leptospira wolffii]TGK67554.1 antibiotic biosynthesis monooxygenase [Leptospira wolffii]TGK72685.1 antibiotic biosynthesis monooxygenase [Leptospira wolffii]TGL26876.1 antibiotic biosynthesis monooxygenase [Leptospira wolffii]
MIVTVSSYKILSEKIQEFLEISSELSRESLKEKGVLRFDLLQNDGDDGRFLIIEAYESEAIRKAHLDTPHFVNWRRTVPEMFSQGTTTVHYKPVSPKPEDWKK